MRNIGSVPLGRTSIHELPKSILKPSRMLAVLGPKSAGIIDIYSNFSLTLASNYVQVILYRLGQHPLMISVAFSFFTRGHQ